MIRPGDLCHVGVPDTAVQVCYSYPDGRPGGGDVLPQLCVGGCRAKMARRGRISPRGGDI